MSLDRSKADWDRAPNIEHAGLDLSENIDEAATRRRKSTEGAK